MTTETPLPVLNPSEIMPAPATSQKLARFGDLSREELIQWCDVRGAKSFRADQIRSWVFGKRVNDFNAMTDLPATLRADLAASFSLFTSTIVQHQISKDGTEKLLLEMVD